MADYLYDFDPADPNNTAAAVLRFALRDRAGATPGERPEGTGGRVLDLGSGPGIVSRRLALEYGRDVVCVDTNAESLKIAGSVTGVRTVHADVEDPGTLEQFKGEAFNLVILADVLEHLRDPGAVLRALRSQHAIADDGALVVSIPNVTHEAVLAELLAGKFEYTDTGLLDRTHIRWFTFDTIRDLLEDSGFLVEAVHRTTRTLEQTQQGHRRNELPPGVREMLAGLGADHRTFQYVLLARPSSAASQLADLRRQLAGQHLEHRAELASLHRQLARHERDGERIAELERLLAAEREHALRRLDEIAKLRRRIVVEQNKTIRKYESSTTWRVGYAIASVRRPKELLRILRRRAARLARPPAESDEA